MFHFFFFLVLSFLTSFGFRPIKEPLLGLLFPILRDTIKDREQKKKKDREQTNKRKGKEIFVLILVNTT